MIPLSKVADITKLLSFVIAIPTTIGTFITVLRTRREAKEAREGLVYSANCLEFITEDGTFINLVPLETLHSLPKAGDIVLLPASGPSDVAYGAYRVTRVEFIYARVERKERMAGQARLAKAVAHVDTLAGDLPEDVLVERVAD
jgi:hypothetical protein